MADKALHIGKNLELDLDAVTQTFAIVAKRGSGKTYLGAVLIEEMLGAGQCVVVLDPVGVLWGLRSSADGKGDGYPILILGGEHADIPLESTAGKVIADWVVDGRHSAVLDLSLFRKAEQRRFVQDFAETLYRRNRKPLHVVLDEADMFAPQRPMPGEQGMLGAMEDLVRRGRARGIGLTMITQRPAVLHKDVLTQAECLVALRMLSPQDRNAIDAWIKFHGTDAERQNVLSSLPSLPIGTAWFWSPGWLGALKKVQIRKRRTFDSSSTPKTGAVPADAAKLAPVDVAALTAAIQATGEKRKEEDPKRLRARIAELETELKKRPSAEPERIEVPVFDLGAINGLEEDVRRGIGEAFERARDRGLRAVGDWKPTPRRERPVPLPEAVQPRPAETLRQKAARISVGHGQPLSSGERKILTVLAQYGRADKSKVAAIAGYASGGGGFNNYLSAMRTKGWLDGSGELTITDTGRRTLGDYEPLPTGKELLRYWCERVSKAERAILEALAAARSHALDKEELAVRAGYEASGGGFNNALSRLRTLELIEGRGELRLREELT